ncbi:PAS domain S-box protein [Haloarcula halophila]|uniref:PAS domain S-box protein n=1 Tax=Haloarcula TaxID=2237 RepID=UPI0023E36A94|nr:PAS domain S-box protein [Halomicroarcula sp. DFY41]
MREIVERERAQTSAREIFDNIGGVAILHDPDTGEMLHANETLCELLGQDRAETESMEIGEFTADIPGYDHEWITRVVSSVTEQDEEIEIEWPLQTAADGVRWTEARLRTVHVGGREVVLTTSVDITERRREERKYQQVFDNVNDVITVHDPWKERIVDVNQTMTELTGYNRATLLEMGLGGLSVSDAGSGPGTLYDRQRRVAATGEAQTVEWTIETAAGEQRRLETKLTPATIAGEDRVLALSRDVTARTEYERRLEQERDRRSILFENNPDPVVRVRFEEDDEPIIREINPAFETVFGFAADEVVGASVEEMLVPEDEHADFDRFRRQAASGDRVNATAPRQTASGTREFLFNVIHFDAGRGESGVADAYVWYTDVTERKRREKMVRSLHESTEAVQTAETEQAVYEAVADAITEVLDLTAPACWRATDDGPELAPVVRSDSERGLTAGLTGSDLIEPGSVPYDAYQAEALRVESETEPDEDQSTETVLVPLDGHGLVAAAAPGAGQIDTVTLDATRILARHATTALDRVQQARERRESERRFRLIAEHIDEIVYLTTADYSEMLYINPAYEDIYGRPVEELYEEPTSFVDVAHPDDRERYEADVQRLIDDVAAGEPQETYEGQYRIDRDGETRWVTVTRFPITNERGEVDRVVGRVEDITERTRREREYEQIFEMAGDGIVVHDPESGDVVTVNRQMAELLGYDREAFIERPLSEFQATDEGASAQEARRLIQESAREGGQEFEWALEAANGETVWVRARHELGEIAGEQRIVALLYDITERKRREREYEQIFDGVTDSITVHDPDTAELVDANETFCDMLGYDREEILEMGIPGFSPAEQGYTIDRAKEFIETVLDADGPKQTEWAVETSDGEIRWLEVKGTSIELNGEQRHVSLSRDVTDRRRSERRLRAVLDRIDEAILITRAEAITSGSQAPEYVSSGYEDIWGQSLEELTETYDEGFFDTLHPQDADAYRQFVEDIVAAVRAGTAAESYSKEYRIRRPDGATRWVKSDYYPTEWDDGQTRLVVVSRDITERKRRERRMASFDNATDDLATADTPEEATRIAVEAAAETLNLPAVGAFLYDDDEGVLRPEVLAGQLPTDMASDPIGPGESPLWEGFAAGTSVTSDGVEQIRCSHSGQAESGPPTGLAALSAWRALSLGSHGTLLVGTPDGSLGAESVQAAHVLAATLEAALNHLEGQRRLAAREEELQTQTERAERLDRIARLTQRVEAAITEASSSADVEQAVCERLAETGPYDLAWIGGVDAGSDRFVPRAIVGTTARYVESMDLTTAGETVDPHPAVDAWTTDQLEVEDSLVGDGPADDWRRIGLSEGYQSLCAVPLTYDDVTRGVLTVGSESPNEFGKRERDVLSQLGATIANALAAIERRRALESDETVELEFRGAGETLPFAQAATDADCRVRLERTAAGQEGSTTLYFSFEGDVPTDAIEIAEQRLPGVVDVVTAGPASTLVEAHATDWFGSPIAEYGGILREAVAEPGETTLLVEVPRQADVRSFVERIRDVAPSLSLTAQRQLQRQDRTPSELSEQVQTALTDRQLEVVRTALAAGYFEWPREHDGSEVATRLDITQPTFNKHLRLAEQQTFELLFGEDD